MADYGLLAGLGEGLQKGMAAYMEGRKLKTQEDMDALKMALLTRQAKAEEEKSRRDEMKTALQYASDLGHMPSSGFSEETLRGFGIAPKVEGVGILPESGDPLQKDRPDGLIKLPGLMGKAERQQLADIDRANTTLVPQGFMAKAKEGGGYEVVVMPENEKQRLAREKHESELKAREIEESLKKAQEEKIRAETAAIGKKTRLMGTGQAKLKAPTQSQSTAYGFLDRALQAENALTELYAGGYDPTSLKNRASSALPGFAEVLKSEGSKQQEFSERAFIAAVLRKESGASIAPSEYQTYGAMYFPRIGDSKDLLEKKKNLRLGAIQALANEAGPAIDFYKQKPQDLSSLGLNTTQNKPQPQAPQNRSKYVPMRHPKTGKPANIRSDLVNDRKREGWTPLEK